MKLWLAQNGEKIGPIEDYEFRSRIRSGEINRETPVWHEGIDEWCKASEIELFARDFDESPSPPAFSETASDKPGNESKKQAAPPFTPWRRLWARWFDVNLYFLIFTTGTLLSSGKLPTIVLQENPWFLILQTIPWLILEGLFLHRWGMTPGKYLLSLKVKRIDGNLLTLGQSIVRTLRVWILGMGMGLGLLMLIGHLAAFFIGRKRGAPLWDLASGYQVESQTLSPFQIARFVLLYLAVNALLSWLMWPVIQELTATQK